MKHFFDAYREKTPFSEKLFNRAKGVMPGGISHNVHYFPPYPFFVKRTKGSKIWDVDGNEYVDYVGTWGPAILGHAHPTVLRAVTHLDVTEADVDRACELVPEALGARVRV